MRKTIIAAVAALALVVGVSSTAAAEGLQLFSGKTLEKGMAINGSVGAPDASVLFMDAFSKNLDLGGYFKLGYLTPIGFHAPTVYLAPGFALKYSLLDRGVFNLAIRADIGPIFNWFFVGGNGYFSGGFTLAPYIVFGFPLKNVVVFNAGFGIPLALMFANGSVGAMIPIAFTFGTEVFINNQLTFNFNAEMGPGIWAGTAYGYSGSTVEFYGLFKVGISYGF